MPSNNTTYKLFLIVDTESISRSAGKNQSTGDDAWKRQSDCTLTKNYSSYSARTP
jgi:hypothetical protein